jgi:hypothetical protein
MSEAPFHTPYTSTPGSSMPGPGVTPAQGRSDLMAFLWLTLADTAIIAAAGIGVWIFVHP